MPTGSGNEELLALVMNSIGEGVLGFDPQGRITIANPAAHHLLGYALGSLAGLSFHETIHKERADGTPYPRHASPISQTLADAEVRHVSGEVFIRADGRRLSVDYTVTPLRDERSVVGAAVVFTDVTERIRAREAQKSVESRLLAIYDRLAEPLVLVDSAWRFKYANAAAHRLAQPGEPSIQEIIGKTVWEVSPAVVGSPAEQKLRGAMAGTATAFRHHDPESGRSYEVTAFRSEADLVIQYHPMTDASRSGAREDVIDRAVLRRIVQDLGAAGNVTHQARTQVGREFAADHHHASVEDYVAAYRMMGLGKLGPVMHEGGRFTFEGTDLFERKPGSRVTTCSFTLGYLAEAVARTHGGQPTLGTEIDCQSRGADVCRFVVQVKKTEEGLARRVKELV